MTVEVNKPCEEFLAKVSTGTYIVEFYATWCGQCKMLAPKLDKLVEHTKDVELLKVNVDEQQYLMEYYEVMAMPTTIGLKDGKEEGRVIGPQIEKITELVKKLTEAV